MKRSAFALIAAFLLAGSQANAAATDYPVTNSAWTDLGSGQLYCKWPGGISFVQDEAAAPPSGNVTSFGMDFTGGTTLPPPVTATTHNYARTPIGAVTATCMPIGSSAGGGSGGAITSPLGQGTAPAAAVSVTFGAGGSSASPPKVLLTNASASGSPVTLIAGTYLADCQATFGTGGQITLAGLAADGTTYQPIANFVGNGSIQFLNDSNPVEAQVSGTVTGAYCNVSLIPGN